MPVGDTRGGGDRRGRPRGRAALTLRAWRKAPGSAVSSVDPRSLSFPTALEVYREERCEPHQTGKRSGTARWLDGTNWNKRRA